MRVPRSHLAGTSSRESRIREGAEISADLYVQAGSSDPRGCRDLAWLVCPAGRFGPARMPRSRLAWECKGRAQRRTCEVAVGAGGFVRVPRSRLSIFQQGDSDLRKGGSDPRGCRDLAWLALPAGRFGSAGGSRDLAWLANAKSFAGPRGRQVWDRREKGMNENRTVQIISADIGANAESCR